MEEKHYTALRAAEASWWYLGRSEAVQVLLGRISIPQGKVLDFGAGFGAMYTLLKKYGDVTAYEVYEPCIKACKERGYVEITDSPWSSRYTLIGAFDVIEHVADDARLLRQMLGALDAGGWLVATVPAHQYLWSEYDVVNHHYRRYGRKELRELFESNGFEVHALSYWNCLLFPIAAFLRLVGMGGGENLTPHRIVNTFLYGVLIVEAAVLKYVPLPIGLSLVIVAKSRV